MDKLQQENLEKIFGVPARLRIMSVLMVHGCMDFNGLLHQLNLTRGNLSMHMKTLSKHGHIDIKKEFIKNKSRTTYTITSEGRTDFSTYLKVLENIIAGLRPAGPNTSL